ncbi:SHUGOSHIN [Salix viminalis]|uniref:SHUGOSHIN n=1 Tax=Salix viminalis TaxID=40686 RepID=A0A9Q0QKH4_SALVM|nr:SHUGOSHIN [Salix viminalis]
MKGERMGKRSSFGNIMRRRLSDITNTRSQFKVVGLIEEHPRIPESTQDLLNQLLLVKQEKAMLQKLVEERKYPFIGLLILLFVWLLRK